MKSVLTISILTLVLLSCNSEENIKNNNQSNSEAPLTEEIVTLISRNGLTADDSIDVNINIEKINNDDFYLIIDMKLYGESWIVSPLEIDFPYGSMRVDYDKNTYFESMDNIIETPSSAYLNDPNWDKPYKVISGETTLKQKMRFLSNEDFEVSGQIFFVLEPICKLSKLNFKIINESGNLSVKRTISLLAPMES